MEKKVKADLKRNSGPKVPKAKVTTEARYNNNSPETNNLLGEPDVIFSYKSTDDSNVLSIIQFVRAGVSSRDFDKIVSDTPFSLDEWSNYLQVSTRTIQRNQKEKKPFQPIQSERIVELTTLYNYGVDVFGDKENFNLWLRSKSIALGGRSPKELLDTKFGIGMIKDELGRIEHGILA